ncbi:MAG TPA: VCBS repeat-containing protein [bacterium]|nr:VCBS repeat-containing protein [bacterium]HQL62425.1 VCBS repeat-containing protein [bacterium]
MPDAVVPFPGDWNEDGRDDMLVWDRSYLGRFTCWISKPDGDWESTTSLNAPLCPNRFPQFCSGDFDGDKHIDILAECESSKGYLLFGKGDGHFDQVEFNIQVYDGMVVLDYDGDDCDDLLIPCGGVVSVYAGQRDRPSSFPLLSEIPTPLTPVSSLRMDINADGVIDLAFVSATGIYTLIGQSPGQFRYFLAETPTDLNPENVIAADMDGDSLMDLVSWTGAVVSIFCGDGNGNFAKRGEALVPYFLDIFATAAADMNQDNRTDILTCGGHIGDYGSPELVALIATEQSPTPTPTATPSPTPILYPSPTPTPIPFIPGAVVLSPEMNLAEEIASASSGTVFLLEPGVYCTGRYISPTYEEGYQISVVRKDFSLIGIDPAQPPDVWASFEIEDATVHFQNLTIHPALPFMTALTLRNSSATLLNNKFIGTRHMDSSPYGGIGTPGQEVMIFEHCTATSISLIHNSIGSSGAGWPRNAPTLSVRNCNGVVIEFQENNISGGSGQTIYFSGQPQGTTLGGNAMEISGCTDIVLNLHSSWVVGGENTGNGIQVDNSTVNITGGTIVGGAGYTNVIATDGGIGLIAQNASIVKMLDTKVFGGKGGNGLVPGTDGEPTYSDASSTILWETLIPLWFRY